MTDHQNSSAESKYARLPCPFCGHEPYAAMDMKGAIIQCQNPDCFGPRTTAAYLVDALQQWNTRTGAPAQPTVKSGILTLDVEGWILSVRVHDGGYEVCITEDGKCPASHYVRLDSEQADTLRDFMVETSPAQPAAGPTHTLLASARTLVHEIAESGTHTRWKRLANALETEEERALASQPSPAATVEAKPFSAKENLREVVAEVRAEIDALERSSAATEREDNTCYVNRSEVRCVLLAQSTRDVPATEKMLRAIDALPIFVAADFRGEPQTAVWPREMNEMDRLREVGWAAQGLLNADTYVSDVPRQEAVSRATERLQRALGTWHMHHNQASSQVSRPVLLRDQEAGK